MRVSKIQNNNQQTSFKAVSPKFQPPRVVLKEKMKSVSVKTLDLLETAAEVPIALFYILKKPLKLFAFFCCTLGIPSFFAKAIERVELKEKMNKAIVLEESDGGKTITEAEKIDFYDAVDFHNKNIYGLNAPFKMREILDGSQYACNEFIKSATELNSDGGIKITDKEKQEFELIKTQKEQERAEKKALKKNRLK